MRKLFIISSLLLLAGISNGQTNITVTSPNGGEIWKIGQKYVITWQSNEIGEGVKIKLKRTTSTGRGGWYSIADNAPNDGNFVYNVPANLPWENQTYKIFVMSLDETVQDGSNGLIQILKISAIPLLKTSANPLLIPGAVLGLQHNLSQEKTNGQFIVLFSASTKEPVQRMRGGDQGAPNHRGYEWFMINDSKSIPFSGKIPPGIVFALKHSMNQSREKITLFGFDPVNGPQNLLNQIFEKKIGGDLKAPSGQGYYWYESTGKDFSDWSEVDRLPRFTVIGLKHSRNQRDKRLVWKGKVYDSANPNIAPPEGFQRRSGGDVSGGMSNFVPDNGFCWYEKVSGPEVVVMPTMSMKLGRSIFIGQTDNQNMDIDQDGLVDNLENEISDTFRPYLIFDNDEEARFRPHEPITLFQVRKINPGQNINNTRIYIKWVFLYKRDGGFGPGSNCKDGHAGDVDDAFYELVSKDNGMTWTLYRIVLSTFMGSNALQWPEDSRLEVYDITHPVIYISANKHFQYFTRDNDQKKSHYNIRCNDVNGLGDLVLVDLHSIFNQDQNSRGYNNVGEFQYHPTPPFVNDLGIFFYGHSAWSDSDFYSVDPIKNKWFK